MSQYKVVGSKALHRGRVINLRVDTIDVGGGKTVQREIIEHPGAVVIAAVDDEGRVLMVRQYRHAAGEALLELPAGTMEPGEEPTVTAVRELQEETGYYPGELTPAGGYFSTPGFCNEFLHLFIARHLRAQPLKGDDDEEIEVEAVPVEDIPSLVLSGKIKDAKTIAGLFVLELTLADGKG